MPQITKLSPTKQGRMALFLDGDFAFSVDLETLAHFGLRQGLELSPAELSQLLDQTLTQKVKERAFTLLSYKSYTRALLRQRLLGEDLAPEDCVDSVLDRLEELGLLDDRDYALRCAKDLSRLKHYAPGRVRQELRRRGLEQVDIDEALEQCQQDPGEQIRAVVAKKYRGALGDEKGRRRAVNGLLRLGYSYSQIREALRELTELEELEESIED